MYLNENNVECALNFLLGLDWHSDGPICLTTLQQIINHLFRLPFTPIREGITVNHYYHKPVTVNIIMFNNYIVL